jgi:hypothetical protein
MEIVGRDRTPIIIGTENINQENLFSDNAFFAKAYDPSMISLEGDGY